MSGAKRCTRAMHACERIDDFPHRAPDVATLEDVLRYQQSTNRSPMTEDRMVGHLNSVAQKCLTSDSKESGVSMRPHLRNGLHTRCEPNKSSRVILDTIGFPTCRVARDTRNVRERDYQISAPLQLPRNVKMRPVKPSKIEAANTAACRERTEQKPEAATMRAGRRKAHVPGARISIDPIAVLKCASAVQATEEMDDMDSFGEEPEGEFWEIRTRDDEPTGTSALARRVSVAAGKLSSIQAPRLLQKIRKEKMKGRDEVSERCHRRETVLGLSIMLGVSSEKVSTNLAVDDEMDSSKCGRLLESTLGSSGSTTASSLSDRVSIHDVITASSEKDIEKPKGSSRLAGIQLRSDRATRLQRLRKLTRLHRSHVGIRLGGLSDAERAKMVQIFKRYDYNGSGGLDILEVQDALADLGLKPSSKNEKLHITQMLIGMGDEVDFFQFCKIVHDRRINMKEAHRENLRRLFDQYDKDGSQALGAEELMLVFKDLSLSPDRDDERAAFLDAVVQCDISGSGEIEWDEFEPLVMLVREKLHQCRREREIRICNQVKLSPETFLAFRHELLALQDAFTRFDTENRGVLSHTEVMDLMYECGFEKDYCMMKRRCMQDPVLDGLLSQHENVDFAILLQIAQRFRILRMNGRMKTSVHQVFEMYDTDCSGDLSAEEVQKMLRDLGISGDGRRGELTSQQIRTMIDEADADSNGSISLEEFELLLNEIMEMQNRKSREAERQMAEQLSFSDAELRDLREAFGILDANGSGTISLQLLAASLPSMNCRILSDDDLRAFDEEHLGRINFEGFVRIVRDAMFT
eukprot:TRINITY_DN30906_c0_g1_i1.p1 TRINITY_DN30906_c0_g1~~TRINITY_DN30906_c0_g1_i1.p1  ORF type:complete len:807 (+),score=141.54 TRINITY_DN30906_c0_g1_i1:96-2516(+)